jgi:glycosyltransferase involved in cell wall biosynthesis
MSLRVIHVVKGFPPDDRAGVPQHTLRLVRTLACQGCVCHVVCCGHSPQVGSTEVDGALIHRHRCRRIPGLKQMSPRLARWFELAQFKRFCLTEAYALTNSGTPVVVHGQTWTFGGQQARLLARRIDAPFVVTLHGWALDACQSPPGYWTALQEASAIICQKTTAAGKLESWGFPKDRIFRCLGPVDLLSSESEPRQLDRPDRPIICLVGRLDKMKRPELLLETLPLIRERFPNVLARFAGDGPRLATLKRLTRDRDLAANVEFCGWVEDVPQLLRQSAVFVALSSHHNSSDLALLEAMAHGLPVVVTESPGIHDVISHGVNGLVCAGEPAAVAAGIQSCLASMDISRRLGEAARAYVAEHATAEIAAALHQEAYARALLNRSRV